MNQEEKVELLDLLPEDVLTKIGFSFPWQTTPSAPTTEVDEDGFTITIGRGTGVNSLTFQKIQNECWNKFLDSPQVHTSVWDTIGRVTGDGFEISSDIYELNNYLKKIANDPRNNLYTNHTKHFGRGLVEGELYLVLTLHDDGFVEVDFRDPGTVTGIGKSQNDGIVCHPRKANMPLFYSFQDNDGEFGNNHQFIPSIYLAYYPELWDEWVVKHQQFNAELFKPSRSPKRMYKKFNGFKQFVIQWDRGLFTGRNLSHLRTIIKWVNFYENLKQYEIDHKKASGAYLWVVKMQDPKAFRLWLSLSDEDRKKTGIMSKKVPGGQLILPPGIDIEVKNPQLPKISEADTDILHMVTSGLNAPEDVITGQSKGTFASVKASRGPQSDRVSDLCAYFGRFLIMDMYRPILFLAAEAGAIAKTYTVEECIDYKDQEPVFKKVKKEPYELVYVDFPSSEVSDYEGRAKGLLGVKHGSLNKTLGISNESLAKKMGFRNYRRERLLAASEEKRFPELLPEVDQETSQEKAEGEPSKTSGTTEKKVEKNDAKEKPKLRKKTKDGA